MKVALVHDWLTGMRGGERCLDAFLKIYPAADIYTLLHIPGRTNPQIDGAVKGTSFLQYFPGVSRYYRYLLPLYPFAAWSLKIKGYDLVISLSHAAAKNVQVPKGTRHICYCFTPMRYIWDQAEQYFGPFTTLLWPVLKLLRRWDYRGARVVSDFVGISRFVSARIRAFYGRSAKVIYPPVETSWITPIAAAEPGEAFLCAGALVPYKRIDLAIKAFNLLKLPLWIVGTGPEEEKLKRIAGPTIKFFGRVSDQDLADFYRRSRALVFPGSEDFGMMPIECLAAGRPVIGQYAGALRETLVAYKPWDKSSLDEAAPCGVFISRENINEVQALIDSVSFFIEHEKAFRPESCTARAAQFGADRFRKEWRAYA